MICNSALKGLVPCHDRALASSIVRYISGGRASISHPRRTYPSMYRRRLSCYRCLHSLRGTLLVAVIAVAWVGAGAMAADTLATEHVPAWGDVNLGDDDRIKTWQVPDVIGYQPLDTLPLDCQANVGKNAYDIRAFAVQFSDCDSTWNVCMSVK